MIPMEKPVISSYHKVLSVRQEGRDCNVPPELLFENNSCSRYRA